MSGEIVESASSTDGGELELGWEGPLGEGAEGGALGDEDGLDMAVQVRWMIARCW